MPQPFASHSTNVNQNGKRPNTRVGYSGTILDGPVSGSVTEKDHDRIRRLRGQVGLSQPQLADAANVSRPAVTKIENGELNAPEAKKKLLKAIGRRGFKHGMESLMAAWEIFQDEERRA